MSAQPALIRRAGIEWHQARLAQLVREAGRTTVQHVAGYERQRRHATLVAVALDLAASLTDQAINLFDRLIGTMFRKADERHARAFRRWPRHQREGPSLPAGKMGGNCLCKAHYLAAARTNPPHRYERKDDSAKVRVPVRASKLI